MRRWPVCAELRLIVATLLLVCWPVSIGMPDMALGVLSRAAPSLLSKEVPSSCPMTCPVAAAVDSKCSVSAPA